MSTASAARPGKFRVPSMVSRPPAVDPRYMKLIRQFPLRPIRTGRDFEVAMKIAGHLAMYDDGVLPRPVEDYLSALTILIEDYDRHHKPDRPQLRGLALLKSVLDGAGLSVSDLGRIIGSQANASMILSGKRPISRVVMLKLGEHFRMDPAAFMEWRPGRKAA